MTVARVIYVADCLCLTAWLWCRVLVMFIVMCLSGVGDCYVCWFDGGWRLVLCVGFGFSG